MIEFEIVNDDEFSIDGIVYPKVFMPSVNYNNIKVVNAYDSKFTLLRWTKFDQISVDGQIYANVTFLQEALLPVIYNKPISNNNSASGSANLKFIPLSFVPTAGETTLPSEIVDHINNTGFTKQAGEWIRFGLTFLQQGELYTATYDTKDLDVDVYNSGNPITFNNLNQIEYRRMSPELDVNVTIDLGDIGNSTIEAYINTTNSPNYDLEAGNLYTFDCVINGQPKSYLYRGVQPLLIGNGNNPVDADDFRDISDYDPYVGSAVQDQQVPFSTTLDFTANKVSTFGDSNNNRHTQTGDITFTYDFTNAKEGSVRVLEILANGSNIILPTSQNGTRNIKNQSLSQGVLDGRTYTTEDGVNYIFHLWYTNGKVVVLIQDHEVFLTDITPPSFSVAPTIQNISASSFFVSAQLNENGTVYAVVVPDGSVDPTSLEVRNGTGNGGSGELASGNQSDEGSGVLFQLTSLSSSTNHDVHVVAEDSEGNLMPSPIKLDATTLASVSLPDVGSYNLSRIFLLHQTQQSINLAPVRIADGSANNYDLFFDANGKISLTSKIGSGGTPSANDLQWYIDNELVGNTIYISKLYCHLTSFEFAVTFGHFKLWDSTNGLVTDPENGEVAIEALGTSFLDGSSVFSELDNSNDFSLTAITNNALNTSANAIFANMVNATSDYLSFNNDRRTQKRVGSFKDSNSNTYFADASAQDDTNNQKRLAITFDADGNMVSFKDGAQQEVVSVASNSGYQNLEARLMGFNSGNFTGFFQMLLVHNTTQTPTQVSNLDTELSTYLGY